MAQEAAGQPLQRPVPSGSQADLLQKQNQVPHPDPWSKMFHQKATISAFQSGAENNKAPRLPQGSSTWTGLSHFPLPQTAAGQGSLQH